MAGQKGGIFKEKLSPFLKNKLNDSSVDEKTKKLIKLQYSFDEREKNTDEILERRRHYEAEFKQNVEKGCRGLERLYRRVIVIEPTTVCAAHCRWCLRGQYDLMNLSENELLSIAQLIGQPPFKEDIREVLITGGDPLMVADRLNFLLDSIAKYAPNIKIARIGSRVPLQEPALINKHVLNALRKKDGLKIELATHINHRNELFDEVKKAYEKINDIGVRIYNQAVLLKHLNDDLESLIDLFDECRYLNIESHYFFHCIPMQGMKHHRTSVAKGLQLIRDLTSCGKTSGRIKPMYTAMTDVGKITLYEGVIKKIVDNKLLLQTHYSYEERKKWNPAWVLPKSVEVDNDGYMRVWYQDGEDD